MLHYQKLFLNREGTIISTYGGRGVGNQNSNSFASQP